MNPYSRLYWSVMDDEKFDGIREDVRLFGSWALLLVVADMAWPAPAYVPPTVPRAAYQRLVQCALIDELPGHRFRVHGLDAERQKRSDHARTAVAARWEKHSQTSSNTGSNAPSITETVLGKAEAKPSKDEAGAEDARDPADAYWQLTGRYPTERLLAWIDELTAKAGAETVIRLLAEEHVKDRSASTLMGRVKDRVAREARQLDLKEREEEQRRLAEKRSRPRVVEEWREEYRRAIEERYGKDAA